ncbi:MAG: RNA polymerase factor sigma-54 [Candidatus Aminicenantes bacterium]|nr:RNA polymerase factor sigma-54 [Candidatus Aminicenantes bacterium]
MALKQQLNQKQVQKMVLAPALQQAIKLLPLTNLEIIEVIDAELSENPMLEKKEESVNEAQESQKEKEKDSDSDEKDELMETDEDKEFEAMYEQYFDNRFNSFSLEKKETPDYENFVSKEPSLWERLDWQANMTFFDSKEKEIAEYIIGNIDEDGYLVTSLEDISDSVDASPDKVDKVRKKIMKFDPMGVGSLSLKEALLVQLDILKINKRNLRKIINDHLDLLEESRYEKLAKVLDIPLSQVKELMEEIKRLNPKPGRKYTQERTDYIVPDIIVEKQDDHYTIKVNSEGIPSLKINKFYRKLISRASKENPEAYEFLKTKLKKAFWFLRSLDQRNNTIHKVADFIVDKQKDFIEQGLDCIKPLTLIELADEIGVHESTVGRVVANKHMMTPRGVFPLKYFFHKALSGDSGEEVSTLRIKEKMKQLVDHEDKKNPLSDVEISDVLAKEDFNIARRTVAKYRKQLNIPPSHIRKRKYLMEET